MGVLGDQELVLNFWYTYDAECVHWQVDAASPVFVFFFSLKVCGAVALCFPQSAVFHLFVSTFCMVILISLSQSFGTFC